VNPQLVDAAIAAGAIGAWYLLYLGARAATRPASPVPDQASMELGTESPAVVSLLVNRWEITEDAAESTLLDLAARGYIELRQPADDPRQTTLHLLERDAKDLRPHERHVLERVRQVAVGGVVPVTALTFRESNQATGWSRQLSQLVVTEARGLGLTRRRFSPPLASALTLSAGLASVPMFWLVYHYISTHQSARNGDHSTFGMIATSIVVALITWGVLSGVVSSVTGERDTPAGRAAASRWLGVRAWLHGHPEFSELPPAAVTLWDRYLPYGAALGVTRVSSAVLDLGMGDRRLVWSSFGNQWHRVRIGYPRTWPRYGRTGWQLARRSVAAMVIGYLLVRFQAEPRKVFGLNGPPHGSLHWFQLGERLVAALGGALILLGAYKLVRTIIDAFTTRTITGQALWIEAWRATIIGSERPGRHYLAVDDGTGDRTVAWAASGEVCGPGDSVRMRVRPWSRRVVELLVLEPARRAVPTVPTQTVPGPWSPAVVALTDAEVGAALGMSVTSTGTSTAGLGLSVRLFKGPSGKSVLHLQQAGGALMQWAWRANAKGTSLPGVGDGAFVRGTRGAVKVGDVIVVASLLHEGEARAAALPGLLEKVARSVRPAASRS
jgi:hypothetical protein